MADYTISKKTKNKIIGFLLLLLISPVLHLVKSYDEAEYSVHYFDVGQGDAALIHSKNNFDIIIDGGPEARVISKLQETLPFGDETIEMMFLTHPHLDHMSGLIAVLEKYEVQNIIYSDPHYESAAYRNFKEAVAKEKANVIVADKKYHWDIDGLANIDLIFPDKSFQAKVLENVHEAGLVLKFNYGENSLLFLGDTIAEVEKYLMGKPENSQILDADIMNAPHHGSATSSSVEFIESVSPEVVIVSVAKKNKYGLPKQDILERYRSRNIPLLLTSEKGDITFELNEHGYILKTDK